VTFTLYDKDDFELDADSVHLYVGRHETGEARDKMLVDPPEKARRVAKQDASISQR